MEKYYIKDLILQSMYKIKLFVHIYIYLYICIYIIYRYSKFGYHFLEEPMVTLRIILAKKIRYFFKIQKFLLFISPNGLKFSEGTHGQQGALQLVY